MLYNSEGPADGRKVFNLDTENALGLRVTVWLNVFLECNCVP